MQDKGKEILKQMGVMFAVSVLMLFLALVLQTLLNLDVFSSITILNVTALSANLSLFFSGVSAMFGIIGTVLGLVWLVTVLKPIFSKTEGVGAITP